jgi:hypothetical protein
LVRNSEEVPLGKRAQRACGLSYLLVAGCRKPRLWSNLLQDKNELQHITLSTYGKNRKAKAIALDSVEAMELVIENMEESKVSPYALLSS